MEGRTKPPIADMPFDTHPKIKEFWGTPIPKLIMKISVYGLGTILTLSALNIYFTRNDRTLYGFDIIPTKDELKQMHLKREAAGRIVPLFNENRSIGLEGPNLAITTNVKSSIDDTVTHRPS